MKRLVLATALAASFFAAHPAFADEIFACNQVEQTTDAAQKANYSASCIREQSEKLVKQEESIANNAEVLKLVWKVATNPAEIVNVFDFSEMRDFSTASARFDGLYQQGQRLLEPKNDKNSSSFEALRVRFSDPEVLHTFYASTKSSIVGKIASSAIKGMVSEGLAASLPVLKKPLAISAASAGDWFGRSCYEPGSEAECKRLDQFAKSFKADYGVDPNHDSAKVLAWLYRRYLEGGPKLAAEWQAIGLDLVAQYDVKPEAQLNRQPSGPKKQP